MSVDAISNLLPILDCLEDQVSPKEAQKFLQDLLKNIPKAVDEIIEFQDKPEMKKFSHKMKLCSSQIAKVLPPLCKIISNGTDPGFKEISHYLISKLRWCLTEIMRILNGGGLDDDSEPGGLFIQAVDNFLGFLHDKKREHQEVNLFMDDLLCHALTIAKMAENEDYNEIAAACRSVLLSVSGCSTISEIENIYMKKDIIICGLINLERKVNIACLRLFLYVLAKFLPPLKSIIKRAGMCANQNQSRQPSDIDQELRLLDLYFERVQLISNYAVGNADCKKQKFKVQCSLASIEFLADYIIPAAQTYYMDPTNLTKRRFLQFLTDECIEELKILTNILDRIVDTPSLFQVLQEDLSHSIPNLKIKYSQGDYSIQESQEIITKCYKVISHIKITGDPIVENVPAVMEKTNKFYEAVRAHADLIRDRDKCNVQTFNDTLDGIIQSVEDLDEYLSYLTMSPPSKENEPSPALDCNVASFVSSLPIVELSGDDKDTELAKLLLPAKNFKENDYSNAQSFSENDNSIAQPNSPELLTPLGHFKENGFGNPPYQSSTPMMPDGGPQALDPYLNKIFETPVLKSALYNRTPYKSVCKETPRNFSFDITEVLETLEINYTPEELEVEELCSDAEGHEDNSMMYINEVPELSLGQDDYREVAKLRRTLDINFLHHKIRRLTGEEL